MRYMPRNMEKFNEMIRRARKTKKLSQTALGDLVGYDQRTVSDWESGKSTQVRNLDAVAKALGLDPEKLEEAIKRAVAENPETKRVSPRFRQVIAGSTLPLDTEPALNHLKEARLIARTDKMYGDRDVPVYGRAQGGSEGAFEFNGEIMGWEMRPPVLDGVRDAYAVYVDGASMYPRYKSGETVWVNPNRPPRREDDVIVQLYGDSEDDPPLGFVKEFVGYAGNDLVVRQHNPAGEIRYPRERVKFVHLIVFSQRGG